jgi:ABC-type transport system substrate-binding protein
MKRSIVLVAVVALLAAACGASEEAAAPETTTTTATTTTSVAPATTTTSTTLPPATTTTAADGIGTSPVVPGEDQDVDDIVEAYLVVFDSATTFEEKAPFITDPTGLEGTVEAYAAAGNDVGGIALQADEVGIDGSDARVIYSFLFAGNPAYSDLEGDAALTDAGWQVSTEFFCEIMVLARVGCS